MPSGSPMTDHDYDDTGRGSGNFGLANVFALGNIGDEDLQNQVRLGSLPAQLNFKYATMDFQLDTVIDPSKDPTSIGTSSLTFTNKEPGGKKLITNAYSSPSYLKNLVEPIFLLKEVQTSSPNPVKILDIDNSMYKYALIDSGSSNMMTPVALDKKILKKCGKKCQVQIRGCNWCYTGAYDQEVAACVTLQSSDGNEFTYPMKNYEYDRSHSPKKTELLNCFCGCPENQQKSVCYDPRGHIFEYDKNNVTNLGTALFGSTIVSFQYAGSDPGSEYRPNSASWPGTYAGYTIYLKPRTPT